MAKVLDGSGVIPAAVVEPAIIDACSYMVRVEAQGMVVLLVGDGFVA